MDDIEIFKNFSLKNLCTFKIGGNAKIVFKCYSLSTLLSSILYCKKNNIKYKVIGLGSNLVFSDSGFDGAIIVNKVNKIFIKNNSVYVSSGTTVGNLINICAKKHLSGLENFAGIPATIGGAIVNNLGAFGSEISNLIDYVVVANKDNLKIKKLTKSDCNFSYRNSIFKSENFIILKAKLNLTKKDESLIKKSILKILKQKQLTQPTNLPSAGSVFKRSTIIPAKIIDELNLKGLKVGDAEISTKHAGFIVNTSNATCKDVKTIISIIKDKVKHHYGVDLETEIEFVD